MKIKGRLILGDGVQTEAFTIRAGFDVVKDRFFGHYQMAAGYHVVSPDTGYRKSVFFPVWVQSDGKVHFAKLEYGRPGVPSFATRKLPPGVMLMRGANRIEPSHAARLPHIAAEERERHLEEETSLRAVLCGTSVLSRK